MLQLGSQSETYDENVEHLKLTFHSLVQGQSENHDKNEVYFFLTVFVLSGPWHHQGND